MAEIRKKSGGEKSTGLEALRETIARHDAAIVTAVVDEAFLRRKNFLIGEIAARIANRQPAQGVVGLEATSAEPGPWTSIESLSRLRSIVGGRFQNLKDRWTGAGFPLREHRGEEHEKTQVDERGWLELMSWVSKQGFEARLTPDATGHYFEIRKLK